MEEREEEYVLVEHLVARIFRGERRWDERGQLAQRHNSIEDTHKLVQRPYNLCKRKNNRK